MTTPSLSRRTSSMTENSKIADIHIKDVETIIEDNKKLISTGKQILQKYYDLKNENKKIAELQLNSSELIKMHIQEINAAIQEFNEALADE